MKVLTETQKQEINGGIAVAGSQQSLPSRFTGRLRLGDQWVTVKAASQVVVTQDNVVVTQDN